MPISLGVGIGLQYAQPKEDEFIGPPVELITEDGLYLTTEDGKYLGVSNG
jgi:hypothetical protein